MTEAGPPEDRPPPDGPPPDGPPPDAPPPPPPDAPPPPPPDAPPPDAPEAWPPPPPVFAPPPAGGGNSPLPFILGGIAVLAALAALGLVFLIVANRSNNGDDDGFTSSDDGSGEIGAGAQIGDHWHALLGINLCGEWQPPVPTFESATGIHSHGDGFVHLHPFSRAGAGGNATLGTFLDGAGIESDSTSIRIGDAAFEDGDECPGRGPGRLRWSVDGQEQDGDPGQHVFADGEVLALAFLPEGTPIGTPPMSTDTPSDVSGAPPASPAPSGGCDSRTPASAGAPKSYPAPPPMTIDPARTYTATIDTNCGQMVVALDAANAPVAVNNFVFLAREKFYDGLTWHRLIEGFVIQGGDPNGDGTGDPGYDVPGEPPRDGYRIGSLAAAKTASDPAGTMGSQFFVVTGPRGTALPPDYANFGTVTQGIEVAGKLESFAQPDESPSRDLYMLSVTITEG